VQAAHLIRHGEVDNPQHLVYARLQGFGLSRLGRRQAAAAGERLAEQPPSIIVASPLERAMETAELVADETAAPIVVDDRLIEWELSSRWAGTSWEALPEVFPGELEAYLEDPYNLPFSPEPLDHAGERVAACLADWMTQARGDIAFVSHQDPIHAAVLWLTGTAAPRFHSDKPTHCSITTLQRTQIGWEVVGRWAPEREQERPV
jgi:broad specificity phosphatase PhoE